MMNLCITPQKYSLIFGIPVLMILGLTILSESDLFWKNPRQLSFGMTFDFLITIPIVYFLLIRKTNIPKLTTYLFIFSGLVLASYLIPADHQFYLLHAKKWLLPILEGSIVIIVLTKLIKGVLAFRKDSRSYDFFTVLKHSCKEVLPEKVVPVFATEIAVFYYGFIHWRIAKPKPNDFSYHKESGIITTLAAILLIIPIEAFVIHILVSKWNVTIAWVLTSLSIYTAVQIFGFLKSITKRYISIEDGTLHLRYGILCEASINIEDIGSVALSSSDLPKDTTIKKFSAFSNLEGHNIIIRLKEEREVVLNKPYGFKTKFKELALFVDKNDEFKKRITDLLSK